MNDYNRDDNADAMAYTYRIIIERRKRERDNRWYKRLWRKVKAFFHSRPMKILGFVFMLLVWVANFTTGISGDLNKATSRFVWCVMCVGMFLRTIVEFIEKKKLK